MKQLSVSRVQSLNHTYTQVPGRSKEQPVSCPRTSLAAVGWRGWSSSSLHRPHSPALLGFSFPSITEKGHFFKRIFCFMLLIHSLAINSDRHCEG